MESRGQFVGTRTLALALKFLTMAMKYSIARQAIKPHIETILMQIALPLFKMTEKDMGIF